MTFYYTSENVKTLHSIIMDYEVTDDLNSYEYMDIFVERYPEDGDSIKLKWIVETFLGIQKHLNFLYSMCIYFFKELSEDDWIYTIIYFHAIVFKLSHIFYNNLYKSMFNVNKNILHLLTKDLSNQESLAPISEIGQQCYDTIYVTDKIIKPLLQWQPNIIIMAHKYDEYIKTLESRKVKLPTIPLTPNLLKRIPRNLEPIQIQQQFNKNKIEFKKVYNMLSKCAIDNKINFMKQQNRIKAFNLLNEIKKQNYNFTQGKSEQYFKRINSIEQEYKKAMLPLPKPPKIKTDSLNAPVPDTIASIKRLSKCVQRNEEDELKWLDDLLINCQNSSIIEEIEENHRREREIFRQSDIERKHLLGQISFEGALLAKMNLKENNKNKYNSFLKEKEIWNEEIKKWRDIEMQRNRRNVEQLSLLELTLVKSKYENSLKKKEEADNIKKESEYLRARILKEKNDDLERKINIIKKIKILTLLAKKTKASKIIDLTETSGLGLLCEMSIAELQERLSIMKIKLKEDLEIKQQQIKEDNIKNKILIKEEMEKNLLYLSEKAQIRKKSKENFSDKCTTSKIKNNETINLKNILNEKRAQRISNQNKLTK